MGLSPERQLVYSFLELSYVMQHTIGRDLELIDPDDIPDDRVGYGKRVFTTALADDKMADLWDAVAEAEARLHERSLSGDGRLAGKTNPFRVKPTEPKYGIVM